MATAAEQLAGTMNLGTFSKATELRKRIWFTLAALIVYRIGTYIPVPGVDATVMGQMLAQHGGGILGMFDMFTGGALGRMTVFALNIMPYISASIIVQIMSSAIPSLESLKKEGEQGRKKLNQYTRYLTVVIALFQAFGIARGLESMHGPSGPAVTDPGAFFIFSCVVSLVGGTMFLMWLGEQITARGVGNGISLIIFAGIVANLPHTVASLLDLSYSGGISWIAVVGFFAMVLGAIAVIVFMETAQRRVVIQHPKRQVGNRMYGGDTTYMPLKVNTAGVIPPIFASSVLLIPATLIGFSSTSNEPGWLAVLGQQMSPGQPLYLALYAAMIIFFSYFYVALAFNPQETADNLKRSGGFVPGRRPGANTAEFFDYVLTRLTTVGAIYLTVICLLPQVLVGRYNLPFYFGGQSLIIIVSVTIDTVTQIQSHLLAHQYQGMIRKQRGPKGRGR